ncbi:PREDICTED: uncharacterized protein LOC104699194 [Camelina sativa]|uniref:Dirigent protein n=1 Tax=Camelina sativa TaxID=90675 RepID=A0ABM0SL68_CAMSA|nr:PREDICTED: uncharacterized protein LOC104699194 [Camelina sativa]
MKILSWNCEGLENKATIGYLRDLWGKHKPDFLFLSETRQPFSVLESFVGHFGYSTLKTVEPIGCSGGLALFYNNNNNSNVSFLFESNRLIDVELHYKGTTIFLTFVYGDPVPKNRDGVWERLTRIGLDRDSPWFLIGDFNELKGNHEKRGGKLRSASSFVPFNTMIRHCGLLEFPALGDTLSWRGWRDKKPIRCRLDRAFANEQWHDLFTDSFTEYLPRIASDHMPVLAVLEDKVRRGKSSFRFDRRWLDKDGLFRAISSGWDVSTGSVSPTLVDKITTCGQAISQWRKAQVPSGRETIEDLKNKLAIAQEDDGTSVEEISELTWRLREAYRDEECRIFRSFSLNPSDFEDKLAEIGTLVSQATNDSLTREVIETEIKQALFMMHPDKAPDPDGMTTLFYQKAWNTIKADLVLLVNSFLQEGVFDKRLNETNICLIPKVDKPTKMSELRPISLCNVGYKIISKVLCQGLRTFLSELVSETQSAFVAGHYISDNILIAQEIFHGLRTNIRQMPIIGGTGAFRFGRGYAQAKTFVYNTTSGNDVVVYNVYVWH